MLITAFIICLAIMAFNIRLYNKRDYGYEAPCNIAICFGVAAVCLFFVIVITTLFSAGGRTADEKIAMYQEENTKIEEQIATVVEQYQNYETEIFTSVKPESSVALVSLYPELKSDTLVQSQIEVYVQNNKKIKELRESKIDYANFLWWLYFGGSR